MKLHLFLLIIILSVNAMETPTRELTTTSASPLKGQFAHLPDPFFTPIRKTTLTALITIFESHQQFSSQPGIQAVCNLCYQFGQTNDAASEKILRGEATPETPVAEKFLALFSTLFKNNPNDINGIKAALQCALKSSDGQITFDFEPLRALTHARRIRKPSSTAPALATLQDCARERQ